MIDLDFLEIEGPPQFLPVICGTGGFTISSTNNHAKSHEVLLSCHPGRVFIHKRFKPDVISFLNEKIGVTHQAHPHEKSLLNHSSMTMNGNAITEMLVSIGCTSVRYLEFGTKDRWFHYENNINVISDQFPKIKITIDLALNFYHHEHRSHVVLLKPFPPQERAGIFKDDDYSVFPTFWFNQFKLLSTSVAEFGTVLVKHRGNPSCTLRSGEIRRQVTKVYQSPIHISKVVGKRAINARPITTKAMMKTNCGNLIRYLDHMSAHPLEASHVRIETRYRFGGGTTLRDCVSKFINEYSSVLSNLTPLIIPVADVVSMGKRCFTYIEADSKVFTGKNTLRISEKQKLRFTLLCGVIGIVDQPELAYYERNRNNVHSLHYAKCMSEEYARNPSLAERATDARPTYVPRNPDTDHSRIIKVQMLAILKFTRHIRGIRVSRMGGQMFTVRSGIPECIDFVYDEVGIHPNWDTEVLLCHRPRTQEEREESLVVIPTAAIASETNFVGADISINHSSSSDSDSTTSDSDSTTSDSCLSHPHYYSDDNSADTFENQDNRIANSNSPETVAATNDPLSNSLVRSAKDRMRSMINFYPSKKTKNRKAVYCVRYQSGGFCCRHPSIDACIDDIFQKFGSSGWEKIVTCCSSTPTDEFVPNLANIQSKVEEDEEVAWDHGYNESMEVDEVEEAELPLDKAEHSTPTDEFVPNLANIQSKEVAWDHGYNESTEVDEVEEAELPLDKAEQILDLEPQKAGRKPKQPSSLPVNPYNIFTKSLLTEQLSMLQPRQWVPDDIINCSVKTINFQLKEQRIPAFIMHSQLLTLFLRRQQPYNPRTLKFAKQLNGISKLDRICQIINIGDTHWVLGVCDFKNRCIGVVDSLKSVHPEIHAQLCEWLSHIVLKIEGISIDFTTWQPLPGDLFVFETQPNYHDCGLYTAALAVMWARGEMSPILAKNIQAFRSHLLEHLKTRSPETFLIPLFPDSTYLAEVLEVASSSVPAAASLPTILCPPTAAKPIAHFDESPTRKHKKTQERRGQKRSAHPDDPEDGKPFAKTHVLEHNIAYNLSHPVELQDGGNLSSPLHGEEWKHRQLDHQQAGNVDYEPHVPFIPLTSRTAKNSGQMVEGCLDQNPGTVKCQASPHGGIIDSDSPTKPDQKFPAEVTQDHYIDSFYPFDTSKEVPSNDLLDDLLGFNSGIHRPSSRNTNLQATTLSLVSPNKWIELVLRRDINSHACILQSPCKTFYSWERIGSQLSHHGVRSKQKFLIVDYISHIFGPEWREYDFVLGTCHATDWNTQPTDQIWKNVDLLNFRDLDFERVIQSKNILQEELLMVDIGNNAGIVESTSHSGLCYKFCYLSKLENNPISFTGTRLAVVNFIVSNFGSSWRDFDFLYSTFGPQWQTKSRDELNKVDIFKRSNTLFRLPTPLTEGAYALPYQAYFNSPNWLTPTEKPPKFLIVHGEDEIDITCKVYEIFGANWEAQFVHRPTSPTFLQQMENAATTNNASANTQTPPYHYPLPLPEISDCESPDQQRTNIIADIWAYAQISHSAGKGRNDFYSIHAHTMDQKEFIFKQSRKELVEHLCDRFVDGWRDFLPHSSKPYFPPP